MACQSHVWTNYDGLFPRKFCLNCNEYEATIKTEIPAIDETINNLKLAVEEFKEAFDEWFKKRDEELKEFIQLPDEISRLLKELKKDE